jgi:hypothetical protein
MVLAFLFLLGAVEGRVVDERTGAGVRKAAVRLMIRDDRAAGAVLTGRDGEFRLEGIEPGRYRLEIDHEGYSGKWKASTKSPRLIEIGGEREVKDLLIQIRPLGVLAGRVLDEDRAPLRGATVMALKKYAELGLVLWQQAAMGRSDDRGEYRLDSVEPGEYILVAAANRDRAPRLAALTFFPRGRRAEDAAVLAVAPGDIREGLDLTVQMEPVRRLKGKVELERGEADLRLVIGGFNDVLGLGFSSQATRKGEFEFRDLPGGDFLLVAGVERPEKKFAIVPVRLLQDDLDGLSVRLEPLAEFRGTVEGLEDGESLRIALRGMGWREGGEVKTGKNGEFAMSALPGSYILEVRGLREGRYVEGGSLRKVDVPGGESVALRIKSGTGELMCFALPGEEILIESEGERRTAVADSKGMVTVKNLPPGRYVVRGESGDEREVKVEPKTIVGVEVAR